MAAAQSYNSKLKQKAITLLLHILQVILQGFCEQAVVPVEAVRSIIQALTRPRDTRKKF